MGFFRIIQRAAAAAMGLGAAMLSAQAQPVPKDETGFTEYMAQLLRHELGDTPVAVKGPLTLSAGGLQPNLDRIFSYCKRNASGCADEADTYAKGAAQIIKAEIAPVDKKTILLVVRSTDYIKQAQAALGKDAPKLLLRPLADGLVSMVVVDTTRAIRPLNSQDMGKLDLSPDQLFELGADNLKDLLKPVIEIAEPVGPGKIGLVTGLFQVGRVANHEDWQALAEAQNGNLLITMPTTDRLFYISDSSQKSIDALKAMAKDMWEKSYTPLSPVVLKWTKSRWELVR